MYKYLLLVSNYCDDLNRKVYWPVAFETETGEHIVALLQWNPPWWPSVDIEAFDRVITNCSSLKRLYKWIYHWCQRSQCFVPRLVNVDDKLGKSFCITLDSPTHNIAAVYSYHDLVYNSQFRKQLSKASILTQDLNLNDQNVLECRYVFWDYSVGTSSEPRFQSLFMLYKYWAYLHDSP